MLATIALIAICGLLITYWSPLQTNLLRRRQFGMAVAGLGIISFAMQIAVVMKGW